MADPLELAALHGMPVTPPLARALGVSVLQTAGLSDSALCSCAPRLHVTLLLHCRLHQIVCRIVGWQQHAHVQCWAHNGSGRGFVYPCYLPETVQSGARLHDSISNGPGSAASLAGAQAASHHASCKRVHFQAGSERKRQYVYAARKAISL